MDDETKMDESTIRENLRNARTARGLTQAEIAERLEISVTAYQKIESGRTRILNKHFARCAETLGISVLELVNGFKPVKDAAALLTDAEESYLLKMKVQQQGFLTEIHSRDLEIASLKESVRDKDNTIATQKLLIDELMRRLDS